MRKAQLPLIAITTALILFNQQATAQNSSPYWSLAGNSNATSSSHKLGTTNLYPLRITTNNTTRIYISPSAGYIGVGTTSPSARLHVNAASGTNPLKFQVNGSTKLYMNKSGGLSVGSGSTPPSNGLYVAGNVGIGTASPSTKLHVVGSGTFTAGVTISGGSLDISNGGLSVYDGIFSTTYSTSGTGVTAWGGSSGVMARGTTYGVNATGTGSSGYGVYGEGYYGVYGNSTFTGVYGQGDVFGVYGYNNTGDYAVFGSNGASSGGLGVVGFGGTSGYGVYGYGGIRGVYAYNGTGGNALYAWATAPSTYAVSAISNQSIGIYAYTGNSSSYAGYFSGKVYSSGGYTASDRKLKQDIQDVTNAMAIIQKLQPKYYSYRHDGNYKYMNLPQGKQYGLIAQDVEQVLPNLVSETEFDLSNLPTDEEQPEMVSNKEGSSNAPSVPKITVRKETKGDVISFKAMNYNELIPILIKGMQEQQKQIEELHALVNKLQQERGTNTITSMGTLSQNSPNPAKSTTRISYTLPATNSRAQLLLTDNVGKTIRLVSLKGTGVINVNTAALSSGVYNYSLLVDGKILETRKMEVVR